MKHAIPLRLALLLAATSSALAAQQRQWPDFLERESSRRLGTSVLRGTYEVFENREAAKGRRIGLHVLVLPAIGPRRRPDPIFFLAGGPGQAAAVHARRLANSWMRRERDVVLVDQRGTGRSNPLRVRLAGNDADLQSYLAPLFDVERFRAARGKLAKVADLTCYTTPIAMDDLDEVRQALGYAKVNLVGGSYGTRAALVYIRRHPESVRCAILTGVAPIAFKNPLFHAKAAQEGFDRLVAECRADPRYAVYSQLRSELATILERLAKKRVKVTVAHPATNVPTEVTLDRDAFAEALRVMMYYMGTNRRVPLLVHRAYLGDYQPFAETGIRSNRGLRNMLSLGMLMSVVGSEDIPRIGEDEIETETAGTFLGDARVRQQMAVSRIWPRAKVPSDYGKPVRGDMPVLFISGTHDPVTPPRWGAEAARHFRNGLHLVVPAAHGTSDPRVETLKRDFLERASTAGFDTSIVEELRLPPLALPRSRRVIR